MVLEYLQDKKQAEKIQLDDPIFQQVIQGKHWDKLPDQELQKKLGLSNREYRVYLLAYGSYSNRMCF